MAQKKFPSSQKYWLRGFRGCCTCFCAVAYPLCDFWLKKNQILIIHQNKRNRLDKESFLSSEKKYRHYQLWSFKTRDTKLDRFCIKINISKGNFRILRIGQTGCLSSVQNSELLKLIILIFHVKKLNN